MAEETVAEAAGDVTQTEATGQTTEQTIETQTPETSTPETQAEQQPETQEDWRDKEIRRKHAKLKEQEREVEKLKRERDDALALAQSKADGAEATPAPKPAASSTVPQDEIQRQARVLRDQERYQEQLQSTNSAGETSYGDKWGKALDRLATFGQVDPADMQMILGTDRPEKVLFELGSNPAEYQRIMDLPPAKRHNEIVKIAMKETPKAAPNISKAPPPTEPVGNRVSPEVDLRSEKTADSDWYAVRQKQKKERFEQQRALGRA
jgi:hypothetical protein